MDVSTYKANVTGQQGQQTTTDYDAFNSLDMSHFIKLLVAEMANQDPMNPMDNSEILQQLSQMREIASNDQLTSTLESVQLGQNMATASSLLGRTIRGLDDTSGRVIGEVDRVSVSEEDGIRIHIEGKQVALKNIAEIYPDGTDPDSISWPSVSTEGDDSGEGGYYW